MKNETIPPFYMRKVWVPVLSCTYFQRSYALCVDFVITAVIFVVYEPK